MDQPPASYLPAVSVPGRGAFVGRRHELDELRPGLAALRAGRGSLFLLSGEPGIGKTRLAEEFAAEAFAEGVRVLWGRCHEAEGRPPYWPWAQVVRSAAFAAGASAESASGVVEAVAGYARDRDAAPLVGLIPELRSLPPEDEGAGGGEASTDAATARFRVFQALTSLLRRVASMQPCLLVLDDVHWADLPSLRLLEFLAHELPEAPISVVATFREVEVKQSPVVSDLVARLGRRGTRLALDGLTVDEVSRFVAKAAGRAVPAPVAEWLHARTEGNPFFLDEIVRLHRGEDAWLNARSSATLLSEGVQAAIRQRLAPLPPDTLRVLSAAAVAGREFDLALLSGALGADRATLAEMLAPALDIELLHAAPDRPGRYRFCHALVRETIYERIPPGARAERHRVYGEILERRHADAIEPWLPELAYHFYESAIHGGEQKAVDYAERAGRHAMRVHAYEDAVKQFERALHLVEGSQDVDQRRSCSLLLDLGEATSRAGQGEAASRILHRAAALARRIDASDLLARAATGLCDVGTVWAELGRSDETLVGILQEALQSLPDSAKALRARVTARLATEVFWSRPSEESARLSAEAVEIARDAGDPYTQAYTLLARMNCRSHADFVDERPAMVDEILALTSGRGELAANAWLWRLGDALHMDRTLEVRAAREAMVRVVQELRRPGGLWLVHSASAQKALIEGRFDEVERASAAMLEQPTLESNVEQTATAALFLVRREQGRHSDLAMALEGFDSQSPNVSAWRAALAMLWADGGDRERALATLDAMTADRLAGLCRDSAWLFSVCCLAEVCGAYGTREQADLLRAALLPYEARNAMAGPMFYLAPVSYYLGLLERGCGNWGEAARRFDAALVQARRLGARPAAARILLARAQLIENVLVEEASSRGGSDGVSGVSGLSGVSGVSGVSGLSGARGGDREEAARLRAEALEIAEAVGMDAVAEAARKVPSLPPAVDVAVGAMGGLTPGAMAGASSSAGGALASSRRARFRTAGDDCEIEYAGRVVRVRAVRGLHYLARLLAEPGREFHVLDLASSVASSGGRGEAVGAAAVDAADASGGRLDGDLGPVLDARARAEFAERLADLREQVEEAERCNDGARAQAARAEIEQLGEQLAAAIGIGGRDRRPGATAERARAAVTKALRTAIERVARADDELADVLARSVRTGTYCAYDPIDALAIAWDVEIPAGSRLREG